MDSIFYHEDFYRQIELIPQENYFKALKNISANSIDYESEHGFISIVERGEQKIRTEDLNIQFDSVNQELEKFTIKKYDIVKTGYGNTITVKKNTVALGFERIALFFELTQSDMVRNIWLCQSLDLPRVSISNNLLNAMVTLGREYNLILVDWNEEVAIRLSSIKAVKSYLEENFALRFLSQ